MAKRSRTAWAFGLLALVLAMPTVVQAQFTYTTNAEGTLTITGYISPWFSAEGNIPNSINGLTVTGVGEDALYETHANSVTIPDTITSIGTNAFRDCNSLTSVYFQGNAPSMGVYVFFEDPVPRGPMLVPYAATVHYLPGITGWGTTFGGRPTALWTPQVRTGGGSFCAMGNITYRQGKA
jgi:hypothetical protein